MAYNEKAQKVYEFFKAKCKGNVTSDNEHFNKIVKCIKTIEKDYDNATVFYSNMATVMTQLAFLEKEFGIVRRA